MGVGGSARGNGRAEMKVNHAWSPMPLCTYIHVYSRYLDTDTLKERSSEIFNAARLLRILGSLTVRDIKCSKVGRICECNKPITSISDSLSTVWRLLRT